jgi:ferritin-like metal-binding protein YciE
MAAMELSTMEDLMVLTLQNLYAAEAATLAEAPRMLEAVASPEAQEVLIRHARETEGQVQRLDKLLKKYGAVPGVLANPGIDGLIRENHQIMTLGGDPDVKDAGLICGQQKIEHYEIAAYGTARTFARLLGDQEAARLLEETLKEEERADELLNQVATKNVNPEAMQA